MTALADLVMKTAMASDDDYTPGVLKDFDLRAFFLVMVEIAALPKAKVEARYQSVFNQDIDFVLWCTCKRLLAGTDLSSQQRSTIERIKALQDSQ